MRNPIPFRARHRHTTVRTYALRQREGIPYEVERVQCTQCKRLLGERPLRRAAA
jgi:RNase P subunit RPR2